MAQVKWSGAAGHVSIADAGRFTIPGSKNGRPIVFPISEPIARALELAKAAATEPLPPADAGQCRQNAADLLRAKFRALVAPLAAAGRAGPRNAPQRSKQIDGTSRH